MATASSPAVFARLLAVFWGLGARLGRGREPGVPVHSQKSRRYRSTSVSLLQER